MIVRESISFTRGLEPKRALGIGYDHIREMLISISKELLNDDTLDGFMNTSVDYIGTQHRQAYIDFINDYNRNKEREEYWDNYMESIHLAMESRPDMGEAVFYYLYSPENRLNIERG